MIGYLLLPVAILTTLAWQLILWAETRGRRTRP